MARDWDIKKTTFSIGDFISWNRSGSLELSPSFQRRAVWSKPQKSYLIDTIFRGLPVPIIFLRERTDVETLKTVREVVDGQQRLRTVISFVDPEHLKNPTDRDDFLVLEKHHKGISKRKFDKFDEAYKRRLLSYQFSVHVLPSDTSDSDVLTIFARMNSTGSKLNDQELRNAEYFGSFKTISYELGLSQLQRWRSWKVLSEQELARMKEAELTSELLMLLLDGMFEQTQKNITSYYKNFDDQFPREAEVASRFRAIMDEIAEKFGDGIAASGYRNKAQFFQLFNLIRRLSDAGISIDRARVRKIIELGERIENRENLPEGVARSLEGKLNRLSNRTQIADFLFENAAV